MKRLIDAEALKERIITPRANGKDLITELIDSMPTIDAIPIEFIQKRIDQLKEMNGRIFIANGGFTTPSDYEQWELERLVREWRDEND